MVWFGYPKQKLPRPWQYLLSPARTWYIHPGLRTHRTVLHRTAPFFPAHRYSRDHHHALVCVIKHRNTKSRPFCYRVLLIKKNTVDFGTFFCFINLPTLPPPPGLSCLCDYVCPDGHCGCGTLGTPWPLPYHAILDLRLHLCPVWHGWTGFFLLLWLCLSSSYVKNQPTSLNFLTRQIHEGFYSLGVFYIDEEAHRGCLCTFPQFKTATSGRLPPMELKWNMTLDKYLKTCWGWRGGDDQSFEPYNAL